MGSARTVLVVEDDRDVRETLVEFLRFEGFNTIAAQNGKEGIDRVSESKHFCAILLDLFMPVCDGEGFIERLRAMEHPVAGTPVLVLSAAPQDKALNDRLIPKISGYIKKPFDLDDVLHFLRQYCH